MIDPSIALNIKAPQFADPLEQQSKALNLLAARQQIAMAPLHQAAAVEQLRGAQMDNQQHQLQIDQTRALNAAYQGALTVGDDGTPTIDTGKLTEALGKAGHGSAIPGVLKGVVDFQKSSADLAKLNGEVAEKQADYGGIVGATVKAANYDPHLFMVKAQHALASKALPPGTVQPFLQQVSQALQQDPTGETARQLVQKISDNLIAGSPAQQKLINEGLTATGAAQRGQAAADASQREAELQPLRVNEAQAKKEQILREQYARANPQDLAAQQAALTAKERADKAQADREFQERQRHNKVDEGQGAQRVAVEKGRLAVEQTNAGVDANGQPIKYTDDQGNPVNISPIAKQIAEYKLPAPAARSYASNKGLMNQVLAANPAFDIGAYEQRYQTLKDLRPGGKIGQQSLALNTLIRHSDDLMEAVGALGNGNFTPANAGYQKLRQMFGDSAPTNFDQLRQYVAGETVKLIRGGGGDQKDMENAAANINRAGSPKQLMDALKVNFGIAGGKMQALNEAVRSSIGQKSFSALDQGATDILKRRGYDTETMKPAAAGGAVHAPAGKIAVISPEGTPGFIDADKWDAAQKRGFRKQ